MRKELAIIVVLYHPANDVFDRIDRYLELVDNIILFDNTEDNESYKEYIDSLDKTRVTYLYNSYNYGISFALNEGLRIANDLKCNYLLTMDQDSEISNFTINYMFERIKNSKKEEVIVCPSVLFSTYTKSNNTKAEEYVSFAITSGNVMKIDEIRALGGFDENLFIDGVDRELCIRINLNKKKIVKVNSVVLHQELGDGVANFLNVYPHSPIRNYYIARNRRYIVNKYPVFFNGVNKIKSLYFSELKQLCSIMFFEQQKRDKIIMYSRGIRDYRNKKVGSYGKII